MFLYIFIVWKVFVVVFFTSVNIQVNFQIMINLFNFPSWTLPSQVYRIISSSFLEFFSSLFLYKIFSHLYNHICLWCYFSIFLYKIFSNLYYHICLLCYLITWLLSVIVSYDIHSLIIICLFSCSLSCNILPQKVVWFAYAWLK